MCDRLFHGKEPYLTHCLKKELGRMGRKDLRLNLGEEDVIIYTDFSKGFAFNSQYVYWSRLFLELDIVHPEMLKSEAFGSSHKTYQIIPQVNRTCKYKVSIYNCALPQVLVSGCWDILFLIFWGRWSHALPSNQLISYSLTVYLWYLQVYELVVKPPTAPRNLMITSTAISFTSPQYLGGSNILRYEVN